MLVERIRGEGWQCAVWDNNFMAGAKSALYVNPVGRYEQPRVAKALPRPTADARLSRSKIGGKYLKFGKSLDCT